MPELPDLEIYAKNLTRRLKGEVVAGIEVLRPKRVHPSEEVLEKELKGAKIKAFRRVGKQLTIDFDNRRSLGVHLMLNGALVPVTEGEKAQYASVVLHFNSGLGLAITDRQAWVIVDLDPEEPDVPDALDKEFSLEYFESKVGARRTIPIKTLLVDQEVVLGIGNAYADEILHAAGVDPASLCGKLSDEAVARIHREIPKVLREAVKRIDQEHPGLTSGEPRDHMAVHNPDLKLTKKGEPIKIKDVGGKKTYYTDAQKLYK